ncbi:MAG: TonB-dependent hemoglobin/transferrin/lactoferrin family receptor [Oleiphilaceae bacterium]|nr:TonB-dependent hemoglobin/transferrin/lactoferrin family receptor [Oleiphilaceae bacterium]
MNRTRLWLAAMLATTAISQSQTLLAQTDEAEQLEAYVVSATRVATPESEVSRPIERVDREDLSQMQPASVAQTLRFAPNVSVSGGPRSANQSVNIRGLEGNKVLQTIDGVRQDFESGHRPSYLLDPALLASVEVVKGPASQLWGSGALGGVVAQNTLGPDDLLTGGKSLAGMIKLAHNFNNDQLRQTAALAGDADVFTWLLGAYGQQSNDPELGNGDKLSGAGYEDQGGLIKLQTYLNDAHMLGLSHRQNKAEGQVPSNGSAPLNGTSNFMIERDTDAAQTSLDYQWESPDQPINMSAKVFRNRVEMTEQRVSDGRGDATELTVLGASLSAQQLTGDWQWFYGADVYEEDFSAQREGVSRPTPPKTETRVWGAYASVTYPFTENLKVETGLRYDRFRTEAKNLDDVRSEDDVSPSLAFTWQASDNAMVTLRHDRAFRAPSSEELYTTGTHFCMGPGFCNTFVSNPGLKSERAANTELMTRLRFPEDAKGGRWRMQVAIFENRVDNFIEQVVTPPVFFPVPDPGTSTWVNVAEATLKGVEVSADYRLGQLELALGYGQTRGKDDQTKEDLSNVPADKFTADVAYGWWQGQLTGGMRLEHAQAQYRTNVPGGSGETYAGYSIVDLYAQWQPARWQGLGVDISINNVTDRYYRRAWQQLHEPGREIMIATRYAF